MERSDARPFSVTLAALAVLLHKLCREVGLHPLPPVHPPCLPHRLFARPFARPPRPAPPRVRAHFRSNARLPARCLTDRHCDGRSVISLSLSPPPVSFFTFFLKRMDASSIFP